MARPTTQTRSAGVTLEMPALQDWVARSAHARLGEGTLSGWQPLAVEASHRRFFRVHWHGHPEAAGAPEAADSLVVMSSPPDKENNDQFLLLAELFADHGINVPEVFCSERSRGWFLMSDLGDTHFADVYAARGPGAVLPGALDTLHKLQSVHDPRIPPYTAERLRDELGIYVDWFLGRLLDAAAPASLTDTFEAMLEAARAQPVCCVHRDFHCRNLMLTASGGTGVVDFQDALMGSATYDLASLLRDCYYRMPEAEVARWRDAYLARTLLPVDRGRFARDLDLTALQRQLKAVGIFARLALRDGRGSHLPHIVPVLERVGALALEYPDLHPLAAHVEQILPQTRQRLAGAP